MEKQPQDLYKLTEEDWKDYYNRLTLFAYKKYGHSILNGTIDIEEVIQDVIVDVLLGIRHWPPVNDQGQTRDISFFYFLCQIVRSKVSHMLGQKKRMVSLDSILDDEMPELLELVIRITTDLMQSSDRQALYNERCWWIFKAAGDDVLLKRIADLLTKEPDLKPKDIAQRLNLSETEVRNAIKRLARRAERMLEGRSSITLPVLMQLPFEHGTSKDMGGKH
ncbi:MAG: sigma-70 family RNA polymerase sigma factor [Blastocatellia bacterium]